MEMGDSIQENSRYQAEVLEKVLNSDLKLLVQFFYGHISVKKLKHGTIKQRKKGIICALLCGNVGW
jgi:hypothetical protein